MSYQIRQEGKFKYVEQGDGQVILVLHGLFGALSNFNDMIAHFSKKYKVVVPIMPLYDMPLAKTGVKSLAKFIASFIEHKKYSDLIVLGNSLGGHVALIYALKNMQKVSAMVLTGSSGLYENAFGGSFPRRSDKEYIRNKIAVTFHDPKMVTDELVEVVFDLVSDRSRLIKVLYLAKSAIRHNMREELHKYKIPVCLIWGKNDTITPPEVAEEFQEFLPDADLYWIDKCAHAPMMEEPEKFNLLLDEWLEKRFRS